MQKSVSAESFAGSGTFDALHESLPFVTGLMVGVLPRGTLQVLHPPLLPEVILRGYSRDANMLDGVSWGAIQAGKPMSTADGVRAGPAYVEQYLRKLGLEHAAAAPLDSPVLPGLPGAICLFRNADQGAFSAAELKRLGEAAAEVSRNAATLRETRMSRVEPAEPAFVPSVRMAVFHKDGPLYITPDTPASDVTLQLLSAIAKDALTGKIDVDSRRIHVDVPAIGRLHYRLNVLGEFPALSKGPVAIFVRQPHATEWAIVTPQDFQADEELARLIPAVHFMLDNYAQSPTLQDISRQVHLSPFHFHRRFTELLGVTPKHLLFDTQIADAQRQLLNDVELVQIAKNCGFAHQSHFTSRFKQATGLTPTHWRRRHAS